MCFYLDVFVLAVIRHLTAATAAAIASILFTGMFVNVLYLSRGGEAPKRDETGSLQVANPLSRD